MGEVKNVLINGVQKNLFTHLPQIEQILLQDKTWAETWERGEHTPNTTDWAEAWERD